MDLSGCRRLAASHCRHEPMEAGPASARQTAIRSRPAVQVFARMCPREWSQEMFNSWDRVRGVACLPLFDCVCKNKFIRQHNSQILHSCSFTPLILSLRLRERRLKIDKCARLCVRSICFCFCFFKARPRFPTIRRLPTAPPPPPCFVFFQFPADHEKAAKQAARHNVMHLI